MVKTDDDDSFDLMYCALISLYFVITDTLNGLFVQTAVLQTHHNFIISIAQLVRGLAFAGKKSQFTKRCATFTKLVLFLYFGFIKVKSR